MNREQLLSVLDFIAESTVGLVGRLAGKNLEAAKQSVDYREAFSDNAVLSPDEASAQITCAISGPGPSFVGRFGSTELRVVLRAMGRETRSPFEKAYALVARAEMPLWTRFEHKRVQTHSGFYPISRTSIDKFVLMMRQSMTDLDLLGSWVPGENRLAHLFPNAKITTLSGLSPFASSTPWTKALEGKKVVVVHPFKDTIEAQFPRRHLLFEDDGFMPDFELRVVRAVQSLGTPPPEFPTWFDGFDHMRREILAEDFDVAIIGCGSYGFPLGGYLKSAGKKAIVLGGIVQLLFGIKGRRWDSAGLYNDNWVRPSRSERPDGFRHADGGAYW